MAEFGEGDWTLGRATHPLCETLLVEDCSIIIPCAVVYMIVIVGHEIVLSIKVVYRVLEVVQYAHDGAVVVLWGQRLEADVTESDISLVSIVLGVGHLHVRQVVLKI